VIAVLSDGPGGGGARGGIHDDLFERRYPLSSSGRNGEGQHGSVECRQGPPLLDTDFAHAAGSNYLSKFR
jgi:hypothetical protein